ncbi:hypothetical protein [Chroococcidiopsis sp.]|uniref:hypothetical protein n=1 Tax=Chroococcidiopsis sp. TaxID=3088168 RepID=UPI003F401AE8
MDAIAANAKLRTEELHLGELGISTLSSIFVNANRDPKKGEPAKPSDFFYFTPQVDEREKISAIASNTFFALVEDEKMPSWAVALAPIDRIRKSKNGNDVPKCRAWMRKGVMLIAPQIKGDKAIAPLALIDGVEGQVSVIDIDTGTARDIFVANAKNEAYWAINVEFQLIGSVTYG